MKIEKIHIGTAGNPSNFINSEYYKNEIMNCPMWLKEQGLNAYEFQSTHGVKTPAERAVLLKNNAEKSGVLLSIHAPYYVVLSSDKESTRKNSVGMLVDAINLSDKMNSEKVIFHPGYYRENTKDAMEKLEKGILDVIEKTKNSKTYICPETGGKKSAIGSLEELITLTKLHKRITPCVDFAHHHARTNGSLKTEKDFEKVFEEIEEELGKRYSQNLHIHFSTINYTEKGEKSHGSGYETAMGPDYKLFCKAIHDLSLTPTIICETQDTQDVMALKIKKELERLMK